jgi:hypothetical protein
MKPKRASAASKRSPRPAATSLFEYVRPWLLSAFMVLCVARPLLPSEGVSWLGDDLPFDMLFLILTAAYLLWAAARGGLSRPFNLVDGCVGALVAACAVSALMGASEGNPRFSINMLWEWVGLGLVFFLTRQLVRTAQEARAVVAVMFSLAVVLAVFGFYQVFVSLPADRQAYAADPEQVMQRSLGQVFEAGSLERKRFEDRLQSTEPLATFALANSLAGFLVAWLVVAVGIGWSMVGSRGKSNELPADETDPWGPPGLGRSVAFAAVLLTVAACLLLTKSRSAYVAVAATVALVPWCGGAGRWRPNWKILLAAGAVVLLMIGMAVAVGGLDVQVLSEASKSLEFRLQYWHSTLAMIARYPWFGVGPGNFQEYYTQFKLPQASEEIRDPHNFVLEVWATGGTFAAAALAGALVAFAWKMWPNNLSTSDRADASVQPPIEKSMREANFVVAGGGAGLPLAFLLGPLFGYAMTEGQLGCALVAGAAVVAILWPWLKTGPLPSRVLALGALALAIHWLAAGGIAFPGVAGSFWILMALALNQIESEPAASLQRPRKLLRQLIPVVAFALATATAAACYYTAYGPVLQLQDAMAQAESARPAARAVAYADAAKADPLSAEPWIALAELELETIRQNRGSQANYEHLLIAANHVRELRPHSSAAWRQLGHWYAECYQRFPAKEAAHSALECMRVAVELYPNSAILRGELALALVANESEAARRQADKALELDAQMPHADKKLPPEMRAQLETLRKVSR